MKKLTRAIVLLLLIFAALTAYSYGNATGMFIFILLGVAFECMFWFGLFKKNEKK